EEPTIDVAHVDTGRDHRGRTPHHVALPVEALRVIPDEVRPYPKVDVLQVSACDARPKSGFGEIALVKIDAELPRSQKARHGDELGFEKQVVNRVAVTALVRRLGNPV